MAEYYPLQFGALAGTDDGSGIAASASRLYGPWESEAAFLSFLREATDEQNPTIPDSTIAAFAKDGGGYEVKIWVRFGSNGYWSKDVSKTGVIVIAGIISEYTTLPYVSNDMGDATNIYYDEDNNRLVLSEDGQRAYDTWKNYPEYGKKESGHVVPYPNRLYVTTDGELLFCTDKDIDPSSGGIGGLTPAQQAAIDSGITADLVAGLKRMLAMNPQYDSETDELTLTDASKTPSVTSTYNLKDSGTVVTYGEPIITLSYDTISPSGGTYLPNISVSQAVYTNGEQTGTQTHIGVTALLAALKSGDTLRFSYTTPGSDTFDSLSETNGEIVASANPDSSEISTNISVSLRLNGVTAQSVSTLVVQATATLYITEFWYDRVDLTNHAGGSVSVTPKVKAGGQTYTLAEYVQLSNIEGYELAAESTNQGETFTASTGAISYNPGTIVGALEGEDNLSKVRIKLSQAGRTDLYADFAMIDFADGGYTSMSGMTLKQTLGGSASNKLLIQANQTQRCLRTGLSVTAGDIVAIKLPSKGVWYWIWETSSAVTGAMTADYGHSSSDESGVVLYKVKQTGVLSIGWLHGNNSDYSNNAPTGYKKVDTTGW